jgi:hypothetical protein
VVDGGGITLPTRPGVDAARLADRLGMAGSLTSSVFVGAMLDGTGDATVSDRLFALPGRSPPRVGVPVRNRLLLRPVPLVGTPLPMGLLASGAGESWGAFLVRFNLILGPAD